MPHLLHGYLLIANALSKKIEEYSVAALMTPTLSFTLNFVVSDKGFKMLP